MPVLAQNVPELAEEVKGRVYLRSHVREAVSDGAGGGAGSSSIQPKTLNGVFGFGSDPEEALARAAAARTSDDGRAQVLGMLKAADVYSSMGKLHEAAKEVENTQRLVQELRFEEGRACILVLIAKIYAKQGKLSTFDQLDEALDLAEEAQEKFQKLKARKCEAAAFLALAAVRHALKKFEDGNLAAKEAQLILEDMGETAAVAEVFQVVATGYVLKEEFKKAEKWIGKAKQIHESLGDAKMAAACVHRLAEVYITAVEPTKAFATLARARSLYQEIGDIKGEVAVLTTLKDYYLAREQLAEAVGTAQDIVSVYHQAEDMPGEGSALLSLAELLLEKEHLELCSKVLGSAHQVFSKLRDAQGVGKVASLGASLKNAKLKHQIKKSMDEHAHETHYPVVPVVEFGIKQKVAEGLANVKKGL
mmetsp:Transcript_29024/g.61769  ORF Transcript_29024/g.61769 Transcript_29024/m.61769 type:complete len:420 (-) Transcript_29024:46-1305(-)|eukprot:CAMPEP_0206536752 /NCGR_PEP_ID=MMETSP0325_2-20121206/6939_1 /ASSEMBLY_ACC=CAM_ASM_000347 /TAXON_ID=2866 /ORGANISM="Crypthecodinium cohnii, Strain Seligo" /LENGTH=419 /DNA_ID=CAMNT_0054034029 /DNA_START=99 /DNA_END=1358 /DNA_ORIENTATION=-